MRNKTDMESNIHNQLSPDLMPIYELEISMGNVIKRVDTPAGTNCSLAVILEEKLYHEKIMEKLNLSTSIKKWENKDRHYSLESGYYCEKTTHAISGPL